MTCPEARSCSAVWAEEPYYITERIDAVNWTYPSALRGRVAPLIENLDEHWRNVVNDFGIIVDDYHSDIQRTAYVLKPGESGPPPEVSK